MITIVNSSMNYGGMGALIGHELIHSLDNDGLKFDENIISQEWLDEVSIQKIRERKQCFIDQYNNYGIEDNLVSLIIVRSVIV